MKTNGRAIFITLFVMLIISGWLMINYADEGFKYAGLWYIGLIVIAFSIYYFGPKLLKK